MSYLRRICAWLLLISLCCGFCLTARASGEEKKIPKPEISFLTSKTVVHPGKYCGVQLRLASPGFITITLLDEGGEPMVAVLEEVEVASGDWWVPWLGYLPDGQAPDPGTYMLGAQMRDEYGNESKEVKQTITVAEPSPQVEVEDFRVGSGASLWQFDLRTEQAGTVVINQYSPGDLESPLREIASMEHTGGAFTVTWDGKILEDFELVDAYPGRYAFKIFNTNENGLESEPEILYINVNNNGVPVLTDESGTISEEDRNAAAPQATEPPVGEGAPAGEDGTGDVKVQPEGTEPPGEGADGQPDGTGADPEGGEAAGGEGLEGSTGTGPVVQPSGATVQLGQPVSGVTLVSADSATVGQAPDDYVQQPQNNYWNLETGSMDDTAIWSALIAPMYVCNISESDSFYLLREPDRKGKIIGEVRGTTSGINVLTEPDSNGWVLAEAYNNRNGAFMRGWVRFSRLKQVTPDQNYGLVLDKRQQTLTLYQDGKQVDTIRVSTGKGTERYPQRETPAGEYILASRVGTKEQAGIGKCDYHIRVNGGYLMHGQPYKTSGSSKVYEWDLGTKNTRGTIVVQSEPNEGQTFSMEVIWDKLPKNMKILILDDKPRGQATSY